MEFVVPFVQWIHKISKLKCNVHVCVVKTRLTRIEPKPSDHSKLFLLLFGHIKSILEVSIYLWQPKHNSSSLDAFRTVLKFNDICALS